MESSLEASNGETVRAITVFAHCIKFLKDEAIRFIRQETGDENCNVNDIQWVLTVPVMWAARSKQFMREAAYEVKSRNSPQLCHVTFHFSQYLYSIKITIHFKEPSTFFTSIA